MKAKLPLLFAPGAALALNADALPEWIQLAPFGSHPTRDRQRTQNFNAAAAAQIVQWFDFFPRKIARLMGINAVPVWVGHPDFDPQTWPDRRQIGHVSSLEARDDGLYGKIAWNAQALPALRDEGHKFPSVAWDCDELNATEIQPAFLWSVGMWHRPNIKTVQPVINAEDDLDQQDDDTQKDDTEKDDDSKPDDDQKDDDTSASAAASANPLRARLLEAGLITADASEDAVIYALNELIALRERETSAATELNATRETLADLQTQLTQLNAARVEDELTRLIETGRCSRAEAVTVRTELNADFAAARAKYQERRIQLNTQPVSIGQHKPAVLAAHERTAKITAWCAARMTETNCTWDQAWTASLTHEDTRALHAAAQAADAQRATEA